MLSFKPIVSFSGSHYFLSNFYESQVRIGHALFPTNEHAFQAAKYKAMVGTDLDRMHYVKEVSQAPTPGKAKYLGRSVRLDLDKWESIKVRCMREIVKEKFDQNPDIKLKLIETGASLLVEGNDWNDTFWGRCNGLGMNVLGSILMEVRGYYYWKEMHELW